MHKIGVIGDKESIYPFEAVGIEGFYMDKENVKDKVKELSNDGYGIIYITESYAKELDIYKYADMIIPAIIPVPDQDTGLGRERVRGMVKRAVGSDILFGDAERKVYE